MFEFFRALSKVLDYKCENWINEAMAFVPSTLTLTTEEGVCVACCSSSQNSLDVTLLCYPDDAVSDHAWHEVITGHGTETEKVTDPKIQQWSAEVC